MADEKIKCLDTRAVVSEITMMATSTKPENMEEDANFISGMLFVFQEAGLADTIPEFGDILDSVKEKDIKKYRRAAFSATKKIAAVDCAPHRWPRD